MIGYFIMTAEQAEEYFKRVIMKEAVTEAEKIAVLKELEKEGKTLARGAMEGTREDLIKTLGEKANVLVVENKRKKGNTNGR